jgi:hypothetical protein
LFIYICVYIAAKDDAADFRDILKHRDKQKRKIEEEEREQINLKPVCKYRKQIVRYKIVIEIDQNAFA